MKHSIIIVVVGIIIFAGFGSIVFANTANGCRLGPATDPAYEGNDTRKRSDDYSWFTHFVCTSSMAKQNR